MSAKAETLWQAYRTRIETALHRAIQRMNITPPPTIELEVPRERERGHFATTVALQLARQAGQAPQALAKQIVDGLDLPASFAEVTTAGPGFINMTLSLASLQAVVGEILSAGDAYGNSMWGKGQRILLEFCSANPTGHLHLGHARGAAVGDTLARLLRAVGYDVQTEYYVNDGGNQMRVLAQSVAHYYAKACGEAEDRFPFPADGYGGREVRQLAEQMAAEPGPPLLSLSKDKVLDSLQLAASTAFLAVIRSDLARYRVTFDHWYHESTLYTKGDLKRTLEMLQAGGYVEEKEGALWFTSSELGDSKDRVLRKQDGNFSYLMPDIAYHRDKITRGFARLINILGSDHHGYIPRLHAALLALGHPAQMLEVLFTQMVRLLRQGEPVKLSKRAGGATTLAELLDEIGVDAARFFFLWRSPDAHLDIDLDLASRRTQDNPVYYIQYAHARICSLLRSAEQEAKGVETPVATAPLHHPLEQDLLFQLLLFPGEMKDAAQQRAPQRIAGYLQAVAGVFHRYYGTCRVLEEAEPLCLARLQLYRATAQVLRRGLGLLGVEAPDKM